MKSKLRGIGEKLLSINIKLLSLIIVFGLLLSTVGVIFTAYAYVDSSVKNYPALRSYVNDAAGNGVWSYSAKEFGIKPPFNTSTGNFDAPDAVWDANDLKATVSWNAVDTADEYIVSIFRNGALVVDETTDSLNWISAVGQLEAEAEYEIQITAKKQDEIVAASDICVFVAKQSIRTSDILTFDDVSDVTTYVKTVGFSSSTVDSGTLKLTTNTAKTNANFTISKVASAGSCEVMLFYLRAPRMTATFEVYINGSSSDTSNVNATFISASNPEITQEVQVKTSGTKRTIKLTDTEIADDENGYYLAIPLSAYSDEHKTALKNGTYTNIKFVISALRYKDTTTGEYATANQKFDGSDIYFDDLKFVSSVDDFLNSFTDKVCYPAAETTETYSDFVLNDDKTELISSAINTGYEFDLTRQEISFKALTVGSKNYGASMSFKAGETALYDLTAALYLRGNEDVESAMIYYRILHETEGGATQIWPEDSVSWSELEVTSQNSNPKADFPLVQKMLLKDEKIVIEAYADLPASDTISLILGNPTTTVAEQTETYKGKTIVYPFSAYAPNAIYDINILSAGKYTAMNSRWTSKLLSINNDIPQYSDFTALRPQSNYEYIMSSVEFSGGTSKNIGYYNYLTAKSAGKMRLLNIGKNHGVSFQFTAEQAGNAGVSFKTGSFSNNVKIRILKNSTQIYPADSNGWADGVSNTVYYTDCVIEKGDRISVEFFGTGDFDSTCYLAETIKVTLQENSANEAGDKVFSPLWERPYRGREYQGSFAKLDGSVWDFDILKVSDKSVMATDYYVTGTNQLYRSELTNKYCYIFAKEQLKVQLAGEDENYGISLKFTAPERAYYNFSTALNVLSGNGTLSVRILHNKNVVWGKGDGWYTTTNASTVIPSLELGLLAGDTVTIQLYADSKMTVGLGAPTIHKLDNKIQTETGTVNVYVPNSYNAFEKGYSGAYVPVNSRFNFGFVNSKGLLAPIDTSISSQPQLTTGGNNGFSFGNNGSSFSVTAANSNTARIEFVSPMDAEGQLTYSLASLPGGARIRVYHLSKLLKTVTAASDGTVNLAVKEGDSVIIEIFGLAGRVADFNSLNINLIGYHNNNTEADDSFYAGLADPYPFSNYDGGYKLTDKDFWNFEFLELATNKIVASNHYTNGKLYSTQIDNAAYYFVNKHLVAEIDKDYGISLGFTSPRKETFNLRYGLTLETQNATVDLVSRIVKVSADGKSVKQVWPAKDWYKQSVSTGESVNIPYAEVTAEKGEKIVYQVYALNIEDQIKINLSSPAIVSEKPISLYETDFSADIYSAFDYFSYLHVDGYDGKYYPMENRWNFKFVDITNAADIKVFDPDKLRTDLSFNYMYSKQHGSRPQYRFNPNTNQIDVRGEITKGSNISSVIQYTAAMSGDMVLNAAPTIDPCAISGAKAKYRVIKINVKDGKTSTVWPTNGGWEVLSNSKKTSDCIGLDIALSVGDKLEMQLFWEVPEAELDAYLATKDSSEQYWVPEYAIKPMVISYSAIDENKTAFSPTNQFVKEYLVSPYWRVQYSTDSNRNEWKNATLYRWVYWLSPSENYLGISSTGVYWFQNYQSSLNNVKSPAVAWLFNVRSDGVVQMSSTKKIRFANTSNKNYSAEIRITVNNQCVWPANGWQLIKNGEELKLEDVSFEVKKGDKIRFEVRPKQKIISDGVNRNDEVKLLWEPAFTINRGSIYSQTDDIYNMLDEETLAFFKTLTNMSEFDEDFEANKLLSEQIKLYKAYLDGLLNANYRVVYVWWVYALIIGGAVIAAAGISLLTVILVRKRKLKSKNIAEEIAQ